MSNLEFLLERKQDLSVYYWVKDIFLLYPTITVEDGYPTGELQLPSIAVEGEHIFLVNKEMGNRQGNRRRLWSIDVYGKTKVQRDFMAYKLFDNIEQGIPVYDYEEGFPVDMGKPTQIGLLRPLQDSITATPVRVFPEFIEKLYWRYRVRFITEYNNIQT